MALMGPDGDTHSYLNYPQHPQVQANAPRADLPDRGHWVGPRGGRHQHELPSAPRHPRNAAPPYDNRLPPEPPAPPPVPAESVRAPFGSVLEARGALRYVLEHQPMTAPQRRILLEALTVLESFR